MKSKPRAPDLRTANLKARRDKRKFNVVRSMIKRRAADNAALVVQLEELKNNPDLEERVELEAERSHKPEFFLTAEEKSIIIELHHLGVSRRKIAGQLRRTVQTVSRFIQRYASTAAVSRMYFEANADKLAHRIVKQANVQESLEVMDRLDILSRKRDAGTIGPSFNVVIGVPGASSAPIPTQQQVIEAKAAKENPSAE